MTLASSMNYSYLMSLSRLSCHFLIVSDKLPQTGSSALIDWGKIKMSCLLNTGGIVLLNYGTICQYFKDCVFVGMFCMIKVASCRSQSPLHGTVTLPLTMLRNGFLDLVVQRNMGCFLGFILKGEIQSMAWQFKFSATSHIRCFCSILFIFLSR